MPDEVHYLTKSEETILATVGYLVLRWNQAERAARQIVRGYLPQTGLHDPEHLRLSRRPAKWIEDELRDVVLPQWGDPGRPYLERLIEAYSAAREHRNQLVHGFHWTVEAAGPRLAMAILINDTPIAGQVQLPLYKTVTELRDLLEPFSNLAEFAGFVGGAFKKDGTRATNADGTFVLDPLPPLITVLPSPTYQIANIPAGTP